MATFTRNQRTLFSDAPSEGRKEGRREGRKELFANDRTAPRLATQRSLTHRPAPRDRPSTGESCDGRPPLNIKVALKIQPFDDKLTMNRRDERANGVEGLRLESDWWACRSSFTSTVSEVVHVAAPRRSSTESVVRMNRRSGIFIAATFCLQILRFTIGDATADEKGGAQRRWHQICLTDCAKFYCSEVGNAAKEGGSGSQIRPPFRTDSNLSLLSYFHLH